MEIPDHLTVYWENCMQVKKQQLKPDMEQQTGSKLWQGYAEYIMWNARLDDSQAGIKIARGNINNLLYSDDTTLMAESKEELKSLLMRVKEGNEKVDLKLNTQKIKIMASGPTLWQIDMEKVKTVTDFILGAPKSLWMVTEVTNLKDACSLEEKLWET